jgi:hypothetical protein
MREMRRRWSRGVVLRVLVFSRGVREGGKGTFVGEVFFLEFFEDVVAHLGLEGLGRGVGVVL